VVADTLWLLRLARHTAPHVFNHQTHHRGQASTLFSQLGVDIGPTDLILLLPDAPASGSKPT
jgi:uncharacterized damage-inducible protein DinB